MSCGHDETYVAASLFKNSLLCMHNPSTDQEFTYLEYMRRGKCEMRAIMSLNLAMSGMSISHSRPIIAVCLNKQKKHACLNVCAYVCMRRYMQTKAIVNIIRKAKP